MSVAPTQIAPKSTSTGVMEPAGEYLAVIGQDLLGRPVDLNATRNPSQQADALGGRQPKQV
jgi:hypothetical protein